MKLFGLEIDKKFFNGKKRRACFPVFLAVCLACMMFSGCSGGNASDGAGNGTAAGSGTAAAAEISQAAGAAGTSDGAGSKDTDTDIAEINIISESDEAETTDEVPDEADAEESAVPETADPELPPEEGMVRSFLTNEWTTAELASKRPIAVMYPTDKKAQPQYGLDRVEIFYEIMEEGSMSRQMGIITDWSDLERIGNIRSTRDYFIISSMEWDSILVHFGGPEVFVKDILTRDDVDNINGVGGEMGSDYGAFYRIPAGSRSEHTAYTDGSHIDKAIEKAGFETEFREAFSSEKHWKFSPASVPFVLDSLPGCADASSVDMAGCYPITKSSFKYNAEDGLYYRSIYGEAQKDAITGEQMAFSNILIESCTWGERGAGYLYFHVLDEGHKGYYITGGKIIPCTWSKTSEYGTTVFYDLNGDEITLNTGKTIICIARDCDSFTADGVRYEL